METSEKPSLCKQQSRCRFFFFLDIVFLSTDTLSFENPSIFMLSSPSFPNPLWEKIKCQFIYNTWVSIWFGELLCLGQFPSMFHDKYQNEAWSLQSWAPGSEQGSIWGPQIHRPASISPAPSWSSPCLSWFSFSRKCHWRSFPPPPLLVIPTGWKRWPGSDGLARVKRTNGLQGQCVGPDRWVQVFWLRL